MPDTQEVTGVAVIMLETFSQSQAGYAAAAPWQPPASPDVTYILGPRTRLGQELLSCDWAQRRSLVLVARDENDVELLESHRRDNVQIAAAYERVWTRHTPRSISLICCAVGCVHPEDAGDVRGAIESLHRDVSVIESILTSPSTLECERIDVVLVSSVIAVAPPRRRSAYGGSKLLAEAAIALLLRQLQQSRLTVLCPGRLANARRWSQPATWLKTSYSKLAQEIAQIVDHGASRESQCERVVGIDARLWLASRGLSVVATSLLSRRR